MYCSLELSESSSTNVPEHFKVLIENLMIERTKFKVIDNKLPKCLNLDHELIHCVALTVALETGFRLENNIITLGFDLRAMRELNSFERFRDADGGRLLTTLYLPYFTQWELKIIAVPLFRDLTLYDILAVEENEVRFSTSFAFPCSKYLSIVNKGLGMFKDLKSLSQMFKKEFRKMRDETYKLEGFTYYSIHGLPDELKRLIFVNLQAKDFVNLCLSSKDMLRFLKDIKIWSYFLSRDFKIEPPDEASSFQTYKNIMINQVKFITAESSNYSGITMQTEDNE